MAGVTPSGRLPSLFVAHGAPPLLDDESKAPGVRIALPTREPFVPLLVALGAATEGVVPSFPITGFWLGSLTRRSVQFG